MYPFLQGYHHSYAQSVDRAEKCVYLQILNVYCYLQFKILHARVPPALAILYLPYFSLSPETLFPGSTDWGSVQFSRSVVSDSATP